MTTALNITSPKLVKNAGGTVLAVSVIAPGSGPGTIHDCAAAGGGNLPLAGGQRGLAIRTGSRSVLL